MNPALSLTYILVLLYCWQGWLLVEVTHYGTKQSLAVI